MQKELENSKTEIWDLIQFTSCSTSCVTILTENKMLSAEDIAELDSIANELKKSKMLYQILLKKKGWFPHLKTALNEGRQTGALHILNKFEGEEEFAKCYCESGAIPTPKRRKNETDPVLFDVLAPVYNFTGREPQLSEIHRKLQTNPDNRAVISQRASVVGLGGIGKTELARKYIQEYIDIYDGNAVWISAQSEQTLQESFRRLASNYLNISLLNVDKAELDIGRIVAQAYASFKQQKVLFVFDNAESTHYLQKYMPLSLPSSSSSSSPYILITSRDREFIFSVDVLELGEMTETDAISFVKKGLEMSDNGEDDQVLMLVNRLQRYPLALCQAVAFIKQRRLQVNLGIADYLQTFEKYCEKRLDFKIPPAEFNTYRETTFTTWGITTEQIRSNEESGHCAMQILSIISYFQPDNIPMNLFENISEKHDYQEALGLLNKYSMINIQPEEETVSVHRLVQDVTRIHLKGSNKEDISLTNALLLGSRCFMKFDEVIPFHLASAYKFSYAANSKLSEKFKSYPWRIVNNLIQDYSYEEATTVGTELEDILCKIVPEEDPDLVKLKVTLVEASSHLVDFAGAKRPYLERLERLYTIIVDNKGNVYSEEYLLRVENLLADFYNYMKRYREAAQHYRKTLDRFRSNFEPSNWLTINELVKFAGCIWKLQTSDTSDIQNEEEREEFNYVISELKEVYKSKKDLIGIHFNWTSTISQIALLLYDIYDTEYAINIMNDVMESTAKENRDKRFSLCRITCLMFFAKVKQNEEKYDEFHVTCQNAHSTVLAWKGEKHPLTLKAQMLVAVSFLQKGEPQKAMGTLTDILKILKAKEQLPPSSIYVGIENFLRKLNRSERNLELLEILKTKLESEFGESHPLLETVKSQIEQFSLQNTEADT